jgi:hypothetical protein
MSTVRRNINSTEYAQKWVPPFEDIDRYAMLFARLEEFEELQLSLEMNSLEEAFVNMAPPAELLCAADNLHLD